MNKISSMFELLTYLQSWSELGANFAVSVEDVCDYFGIDFDSQLLKISEDEYLLDGIYATSAMYGLKPQLALAQFTTWIFNLTLGEIGANKREEFKIFWKELSIAMYEGRIDPRNGNPKNVGL